jgi:hypothetical protein
MACCEGCAGGAARCGGTVAAVPIESVIEAERPVRRDLRESLLLSEAEVEWRFDDPILERSLRWRVMK